MSFSSPSLIRTCVPASCTTTPRGTPAMALPTSNTRRRHRRATGTVSATSVPPHDEKEKEEWFAEPSADPSAERRDPIVLRLLLASSSCLETSSTTSTCLHLFSSSPSLGKDVLSSVKTESETYDCALHGTATRCTTPSSLSDSTLDTDCPVMPLRPRQKRSLFLQLGGNVNINNCPEWPPIKQNAVVRRHTWQTSHFKFTTNGASNRNRSSLVGMTCGKRGVGLVDKNTLFSNLVSSPSGSCSVRSDSSLVASPSLCCTRIMESSDSSFSCSSIGLGSTIKSHYKSPYWLDSIATLCDGVETCRSSLGRSAGLGLFACREFPKNSVITEFVGWTIDREDALRLRFLRKASHIVKAFSMQEYIYGAKDVVAFIGGASFANDGSADLGGPGNNTKWYDYFDNCQGRHRKFLKALRDIQVGEEIFVSYHRDYWKDVGEEDGQHRLPPNCKRKIQVISVTPPEKQQSTLHTGRNAFTTKTREPVRCTPADNPTTRYGSHDWANDVATTKTASTPRKETSQGTKNPVANKKAKRPKESAKNNSSSRITPHDCRIVSSIKEQGNKVSDIVWIRTGTRDHLLSSPSKSVRTEEKKYISETLIPNRRKRKRSMGNTCSNNERSSSPRTKGISSSSGNSGIRFSSTTASTATISAATSNGCNQQWCPEDDHSNTMESIRKYLLQHIFVYTDANNTLASSSSPFCPAANVKDLLNRTVQNAGSSSLELHKRSRKASDDYFVTNPIHFSEEPDGRDPFSSTPHNNSRRSARQSAKRRIICTPQRRIIAQSNILFKWEEEEEQKEKENGRGMKDPKDKPKEEQISCLWTDVEIK